MAALHANMILLYGALAGNLFLALVAGAYAAFRRPLPSRFWTLTVVVVAIVALQVALGVVALAGGTFPRRGLHLLYGALVAATAVIQVGLRPGGALRRRYADALAGGEARILALVCLTAFAVVARAWMTGMGLR